MPKPIVIPPAILECWLKYDGGAFRDAVIATRTGQDWYAVLMQDAEGNFYAVDFNWHGPDQGWEVSNDYIDFDSVKHFKNEKLIRTFL